MTVAQLKQSLDDDELAYWMAYDRLDPIGGYRLDANFAMLAEVFAKVQGANEVKLSDFVLFDPDPISEEEAERREREAERQRAIEKGEQLKAQVAKMLEKQKKTIV